MNFLCSSSCLCCYGTCSRVDFDGCVDWKADSLKVDDLVADGWIDDGSCSNFLPCEQKKIFVHEV